MFYNNIISDQGLKNDPPSYYSTTALQLENSSSIRGQLVADVCIVGGGYTGLSAALHLAKMGHYVIVLEAHRIGSGASGRNGGQLGTGQRRDQDELEIMMGKQAARDMWQLAQDAKALVKSIISENDINCDYRPGIIHADHKKRYVRASEEYAAKLNRDYNYSDISFLEKSEVRNLVGSDNYHGGTLDLGAGHLHPLKYARGLAEAARRAGATIFEESPVIKVENGARPLIKTDRGEVLCDSILFACNGYLGGLGGAITAPIRKRVMPINNYIVVSEPLADDFADDLLKNDYAVADSRFVVNYFRMVRDAPDQPKRLLFGGGETYGLKFPKDIKSFVRRPLVKVYPQMRDRQLDFGWGGTLAITIPRMPAFQRLASNIYSASGYSGHGVGMATMGGKILADVVVGDSAGFDLFQKMPSHHFPGGAMLRWPLLATAMTYYAIRDRL